MQNHYKNVTYFHKEEDYKYDLHACMAPLECILNL